MLRRNFFLAAVAYLSLVTCIESSNILFALPIATKSHKNVFDPLIDGLARRGHKVTVISPLKTSKVPSVKEIVPLSFDQVMGTMKDAFVLRQEGRLSFLTSMNFTAIDVTCSAMYEAEEVQWLMKNEKFDLIIFNGFVNQCSFALIHQFKCPHMLLFSMVAPSSLVEKVGNHFPSSFCPEPFLPFSDRMTAIQRMTNLAVGNVLSWLGHFFFYPKMETIYHKYLPDAPGIAEFDKNISMVLMNSHFSLTYHRPLLPSVVEVGGMHCRPGQPLPQDLEDFISGAEHGVILISFGSIVKAKNMPEKTRKAFVNVFSRLKQRVIWKWETEEMSDLPDNVKLSKWLPQQDILAHPNTRLFITHGGLLSTQEAVYHGVPLIGIPFFADQDLNMGQAEKAGYCLTLEILDMPEETLESAVTRVLNEPRFRENVQRLSTIYRDQPETPLERAVFWTEYVIRHKGGRHMQSAAKDLNFFQYHSLDVVAFLALTFGLTTWLLKFIFWNLLCSKVIGRHSKRRKSVPRDKKVK